MGKKASDYIPGLGTQFHLEGTDLGSSAKAELVKHVSDNIKEGLSQSVFEDIKDGVVSETITAVHDDLAELMGLSDTVDGLVNVVDTINIDLSNAGLDPTGKTDCSAILQQYFTRALKGYPTKGVRSNQTTYLTIELRLPKGQYLINNTIVVDGTLPNNPYVSDIITFSLRGAGGTSGTTLVLGNSTNKMFDFVSGTIDLSNLKFIGNTVYNSIFATVGRNARVLNGSNSLGDVVIKQSVTSNCEWYYWNKIFVVGQMFDSAFYDCGFFNFSGTTPIAFEIEAHEEDNSNNLMFYRCHWEQLVGGTFFKATGADGSVRKHNNFGFYGCHFETRSWNTVILDLDNCHTVGFYNTQFTHNNTQGANQGVTEANMVPMFKLKTLFGVSFNNCTISRQSVGNPSAMANKLFELAGRVAGIELRGGTINPAIDSATWSTDDLMQSNPTTPYISNGESWIYISNAHTLDTRQPPLHPDTFSLSSPTHRTRKWGLKHNPNNKLQIGYTSTSDKNFDYTAPFELGSDGVFAAKAFTGVKKTIANGAVDTFSAIYLNNTNRRGIYMVYSNFPGDAYALFFNSGSDVFPMYVGSMMSLAKADPATSGKLNVYLNANGEIVVKNLLGSGREVVVVPFGF